VRIRPRNLSFELESDGDVVSIQGIPEELYSGDRLRFVKEGRVISVEEAQKLAVLDGELSVANGDFLPVAGVLPVAVSVDGLFRLEPADCRLSAKYSGVEMPRGSIRTSECTVVPGTFGSTSVDASDLLTELAEKCGVAGWAITKNGEPQAPTFQIGSAEEPVRLGVATISNLPNRKVSCSGISSPVSVTASNASAEIQTQISLDLIRRGNRALAMLLAIAIALVVSLMSLLLLRLINHLMGRTIDPSCFYYYEARARLKVGTGQKAIYEILPDPAQRSKMDRLRVLQSDASRRSLTAGSLSFKRRLPGMFSPFGDSRLVLTTNQVAKFWQVNTRGDGLRLSFSRALIFSTEPRVAGGESSTFEFLITAIVPRSGQRSGFEGAEALIAERGQPLCEALHASVKSHVAGDVKVSPAEADRGGSCRRRWIPVRRSAATVPNAAGPKSEAPLPKDGSPPQRPPDDMDSTARPPQPPSSGRAGPPGPPRKRD
jgi:hypothetical protein